MTKKIESCRGLMEEPVMTTFCGTQEIKDEASSILVSALADYAFRVCSSKVKEPLEILNLLGK